MEKKKKIYRTAADLFFLVIACSVGAFSTTAVMIPNGLTSGGLTGIVRILQNFVDIDFSILYYALAIVIWFVVIALLGMREARKVLVVTILYPAILVVFEQLDFQLLEEKDVILAAIFCGVFAGVCNGLVFWRGYSFCGTESVAKIIKKKLLPHVDISRILLVLDSVIIVLSAFIFGRNIALYALVTQLIENGGLHHVRLRDEDRSDADHHIQERGRSEIHHVGNPPWSFQLRYRRGIHRTAQKTADRSLFTAGKHGHQEISHRCGSVCICNGNAGEHGMGRRQRLYRY